MQEIKCRTDFTLIPSGLHRRTQVKWFVFLIFNHLISHWFMLYFFFCTHLMFFLPSHFLQHGRSDSYRVATIPKIRDDNKTADGMCKVFTARLPVRGDSPFVTLCIFFLFFFLLSSRCLLLVDDRFRSVLVSATNSAWKPHEFSLFISSCPHRWIIFSNLTIFPAIVGHSHCLSVRTIFLTKNWSFHCLCSFSFLPTETFPLFFPLLRTEITPCPLASLWRYFSNRSIATIILLIQAERKYFLSISFSSSSVESGILLIDWWSVLTHWFLARYYSHTHTHTHCETNYIRTNRRNETILRFISSIAYFLDLVAFV